MGSGDFKDGGTSSIPPGLGRPFAHPLAKPLIKGETSMAGKRGAYVERIKVKLDGLDAGIEKFRTGLAALTLGIGREKAVHPPEKEKAAVKQESLP